jgi:hypothetical protein
MLDWEFLSDRLEVATVVTLAREFRSDSLVPGGSFSTDPKYCSYWLHVPCGILSSRKYIDNDIRAELQGGLETLESSQRTRLIARSRKTSENKAREGSL